MKSAVSQSDCFDDAEELFAGWRRLMEVFNVTAGSVQSCVEVLSKNNILAIAPGELVRM